jgi:hypothetical protein
MSRDIERSLQNININPINNYADIMLNDVFQRAINSVPAKYGKGRPPLHFEERHKRELEKQLKPKKPVGRPRKNTL